MRLAGGRLRRRAASSDSRRRLSAGCGIVACAGHPPTLATTYHLPVCPSCVNHCVMCIASQLFTTVTQISAHCRYLCTFLSIQSTLSDSATVLCLPECTSSGISLPISADVRNHLTPMEYVIPHTPTVHLSVHLITFVKVPAIVCSLRLVPRRHLCTACAGHPLSLRLFVCIFWKPFVVDASSL